MDLSEYKLEPLNTDGRRILYRGVHASPADALPRVLVVAPAGEYSSPETLARLEHEYSLAAELVPQWAVRPLALVRQQGCTVLVLEDPGAEPLDRLLGTLMEVGAFLRLAVSIAQAIGGVHDAGLIHKDIKPGNVVVVAASGEVRLTGFGIASRMRRERAAPAPPEVIAGTLAYMAPEQTGRMNRSLDSRSLSSAGSLACASRVPARSAASASIADPFTATRNVAATIAAPPMRTIAVLLFVVAPPPRTHPPGHSTTLESMLVSLGCGMGTP